MRPSPLILLAGCHLFSAADIPVTCDDMPSCTPDTSGGGDADTDVDTDTDTDTDPPIDTGPDFTAGQGLVLSYTLDGGWWARALDAPSWSSALVRHGSGEGLVGPTAYAPDSGRIYVAASAAGLLYALGSTQADSPTLAWPLPDGTTDIALQGSALVVLAETSIYVLADETSELREIDLTGLDLDGIDPREVAAWEAAFTGDDGIYIIAEDDEGSRDVVLLDEAGGTLKMIANDFDASGSYSRAGGTVGANGAVYACARTGAIDLVADGGAERVAYPTTAGDIVGCGWDGTLEQILLFSMSEGVLGLGLDAGDRPDTLFLPEGDDFSLQSGNVY